jgi:hypothetical protein
MSSPPSLSRVSSRSPTLPDRVVFYADAKWGKTSFTAMMPDPIFLTTRGEDGLQTLIASGRLPETPHFTDLACQWDDVLGAIDELIQLDHKHRTFILDTTNGAEQLGHEYVCQEDFDGLWGEKGFDAFGRGEKTATKRLWLPLLARLDRLRELRRMRIILCCHTVIRPFTPPDGPAYDRVEPALSRSAWAATSKWCDMTLYGAWHVETEAIRKEKGKTVKTRASGGKIRVLHTERSATFDAGNRHGLPALIKLPNGPDMAFEAFRNSFPRARENGKHGTPAGNERGGEAPPLAGSSEGHHRNGASEGERPNHDG